MHDIVSGLLVFGVFLVLTGIILTAYFSIKK